MTNAFSRIVLGDGLYRWQGSGARSRKYAAIAAGAVAASLAAKRLIGQKAHERRRRGAAAAAELDARAGAVVVQADGSKQTVLRVDLDFVRTLLRFIRICVPGIFSPEFRVVAAIGALLVCRSWLDIWTSDNGGDVVKAIVGRNKAEFIRHAIRNLLLMMFPIALVNNLLKYSISRLKTMMRRRLSLHFHSMYLKKNTFYKVSNLDKRMRNVDQLLTTDIDRFCSSIADLYSNLSKPILDIVLFSHRLSKTLGAAGPLGMIGYFCVAAGILRAIQPPFGKLTADEQRLEGEYRLHHSRLIVHSEEIAFYRGGSREKQYINGAFDRVVGHLHKIFAARLWIGFADSILVKYIATVVGYCMVSLPIFFRPELGRLAKILMPASPASTSPTSPGATGITQAPEQAEDIAAVYTRNSRLLISLAGAIGRLVLAAKEITRLTGYCHRVAELQDVLSEMSTNAASIQLTDSQTLPTLGELAGAPVSLGRVRRDGRDQCDDVGSALTTPPDEVNEDELAAEWNIDALTKPGTLIIGGDEMVRFERINIVSPDRILLCRNLTFTIQRGTNVLITGPNGCGKSSTFRVLAGIWPLYNGVLTRPRSDRLFYVPQRPYLALGTLRDQVTYPLLWEEAVERHQATDESVWELLTEVHLRDVAFRKGGLDVELDWSEVLSGGEKQRLAMARLFFHRPAFAVLDECTSAVSLDVEGFLYTRAKDLGISLITVSHRPSLWRFHEKLLKFDGNGGYEFRDIEPDDVPALSYAAGGETAQKHVSIATRYEPAAADATDEEHSHYDSDEVDNLEDLPINSPHRTASYIDLNSIGQQRA
mmetsp:Transcript_14133/g.37940  ORF Transcript_14133/g.37940 Transcript_14133/m.37940 type:complete len:820 (-) Transcript_14133:174-2633(-)